MTTFGTDPEFLLVDDLGNPKSAMSVVKGTTESPIELDDNLFYYDNVLAECTVQPGATKEAALNNIKAALKSYSGLVKPYKLAARASAEFDDSELTHPDARIAGCGPETCAYSLMLETPAKEEFATNNLRSCGGHIHLGENFAVKTEEGPEPFFVIYMMDLFVGIPSLFLDSDPSSADRRKLYGKAGRFRKKEYGVEYRSLSNFWLQSPTFASLIYDLSMFAVDFVADGRINDYWSFDEEIFYESEEVEEAFQCKGYDPTKLKEAIDSSNQEAAQPFLKLAKRHLPIHLSKAITSLSQTRSRSLYEEWGI